MDIKLHSSDKNLIFEFSEKLDETVMRNLETKIHQIAEFIFENMDLKNIEKIQIQTIGDICTINTNNQNTNKINNLLNDLRKITKTDLNIEIDINEKIYTLIHEKEMHFKTQFVPSKTLSETKATKISKPAETSFFDMINSEIKKVARFFDRFFTYHFFIKQSLNQEVSDTLKNTLPKDYKKEFVNLIEKSSSFTKLMLKQNPNLESLFDANELMYLFERAFVEQMNHALKTSKLPELHEHDVRQFKIDQTFKLISNPDCATYILKRELSRIPSSEMPLEALRAIHVTDKNQQILAQTWERVLAELYANGRLDHIDSTISHKDRLIQAENAAKFMHAVELRPVGLPLQSDVLKKVPLDKLKNLIIQENAFFNSPISLNNEHLKEKQKIYTSKIKPALDAFLEKSITDKGSKALISILTREPTLHAQFQQQAASILSDNETQYFSNDDLTDVFIRETERILITKFYFTRTQIENLVDFRHQKNAFDNGTISLNDDEPNRFQNTLGTVPPDEDLFLGNDVIDNILEEGFDHPAKIPPQVMGDLITLTQMLSRNAKLSPLEQEQLKKSLDRLVEYPDLITLLSQFKTTQKTDDALQVVPLLGKFASENQTQYEIPAGITEDALKFIENHRAMIQQFKANPTELAKKAEALLNKYDKHQPISDQERLSYRELAQLHKLTRSSEPVVESPLVSHFVILEGLGISDMFSHVKKAKAIMKRIDEILEPAFRQFYQDGDILAYSGKKKESWLGQSLKFDERLTMFITDYGLTHGLKTYFQEGKVNISHVLGRYMQEDLSLYHVAISEAWRVNVIPLIPKNVAAILQNSLGNDWETVIQDTYQQIEKDLHQNIKKRFISIENDPEKRFRAGLANFHPFINLFGGYKGEKVQSHHEPYEQDFVPIYKQFIKGEPVKEVQICSEFVSKSTLTALMKLNRMLAKEFSQQFPEFKKEAILKNLENVPIDDTVREYLEGTRHFGPNRSITLKAEEELKKILETAGYETDDIDLIIRINNKEIFDLPYDKTERMTTIHPGRMITILEKKNCLEKLPEPKEFRDLIRVPS